MYRHLILAACLTSLAAISCGDDDDSDVNVTAGSGGSGSGGSGTAGRTSGTAGSAGKTSTSGSGGSAGRAGSAAGGAGNAGAGKGGTGGKAAGGAGGNAAGSGGNAGGTSTDKKDIVDTAVAAGTFKQLAAALTKAELVDALKGAGPFTVFAPTDAAFDALEAAKPGTVAGLTKEQLGTVLKYHVISGVAIKSSDLKNGQLAKSLEGTLLGVDLSGDKPKINGATVITADIEASNGIIHVIDQVLLPPGDIVDVASANANFSQLTSALTSAGLVSALKGEGPFTVFAPTNAAFAKLASVPTGDALKAVLQYHVISGAVGPTDLKEGGAAVTLSGSPVLFSLKDGAKINAAGITTTNVIAKNGVIHVIDTVIVPPADDIVATASKNPDFEQLTAALTSAGLVATLQGPGPFTVFAPTDAAFAALGTAPTGDALKNVLLYHVVAGAVGSGDLKAGTVPTQLTNKNLTIDLTDGVKINDAKVSTANVLTKNGIIHIVDKVLVPAN